MKKSRLVYLAVAAAVAAAAVYGVVRYRAYVRDCADRDGARQLKEFYRLAGNGYPDKAAQAKMRDVMAEMEKTMQKCSSGTYEALFGRCLDGAFIIGDYAKAESLMDDLPGRSENWRNGAKAKIRAHAALEKGDKAAAISEFQAFLESVKAEPGEMNEIDPYTGTEWTKDMIVAHNLKRMGDLSADIGKTGDAARYRAEAKALFDQALKAAGDDQEMKDAIIKCAGDLLK